MRFIRECWKALALGAVVACFGMFEPATANQATIDIAGSTVSVSSDCDSIIYVQLAFTNGANVQGVTLGSAASAAGWSLETNASGPDGTYIAQGAGLHPIAGGAVFEVDGCSFDVHEGSFGGLAYSEVLTQCFDQTDGFTYSGAGPEQCDTGGGGGTKPATDPVEPVTWSRVRGLYR